MRGTQVFIGIQVMRGTKVLRVYTFCISMQALLGTQVLRGVQAFIGA